MNVDIRFWLLPAVLAILLAGCQSRPTDQGQQYKDGHMTHDLQQVFAPNTKRVPVNSQDYQKQVQEVANSSGALFKQNSNTYQAVERWIQGGARASQLAQYGLTAWQMEGVDGYGNVQFTGYYTPLLQARHTRQGEYQYPLYKLPPKGKKGKLPSRAAIYSGAINPKYILAYSNSLLDNFIMEVQGSGYVDFADGSAPVFFSYSGKNGHRYNSIGSELVKRGDIPLAEISLKS
ncbi:MAG: murein transglycosylase A, partial [Enterobacteriaceae bacterium]